MSVFNQIISLFFRRLVWVMLLTAASVTILVHMYASWKTYSHSSTEIVLEDPRYPLSEIDFPAVTICSVNKVLYSKAKKFILEYDTLFLYYITI